MAAAEELLARKDRYDKVARLIFEAAIVEGRCAELLLSLLAGAACTVDPAGRLVITWVHPDNRREVEEGA
jgi:hypothetical protein